MDKNNSGYFDTGGRYLPENSVIPIEEIDSIVDRLRAGKYGKNPPTIFEILSTGFVVASTRGAITTVGSHGVVCYSSNRWASLSKPGLTMRTNKLCKLLGSFVQKNMPDAKHLENIEGIVWRCTVPTSDINFRPMVFLSGNLSSVKMTFELVYKPVLTDMDGATVVYDYIKLGDENIANHLNAHLLKDTKSKQEAYQKQIDGLLKRIESLKILQELISN
jgi:hypothetical protein